MAQNVKKEINFLEKHISKDKDSVLFARLADRRLENDEVEKAIQICEQGLQKHPYYITGHLVMAKCYLAASFKKEAKEELYRVLTFDPNNVVANKLLSVLLEEEGDNDSALEYRKSIILADPLNKESESILKDIGAQAPVTEKAAVVEPESGILKEAAVDEGEALLEEDLEDLADVVSEVEIEDEEAVAAEDETIAFPEEEAVSEEAEEAALEDKEAVEPEAEESIIDEELDKLAAEEDITVDLESAEEEIETMQESEVESTMEDITVEPESEIEEEIDLKTEEAKAADESVEDEVEVQSLDDKDLEEIAEVTPADIKEEEIELSSEEIPEVEEDEPEIAVEPTEIEDKAEDVAKPAELEEEVHPEAESGEKDISFEEYMKSDEEIDVKFDEDEAEHLEEPVIKSLDLEKDFEINESLEAEKQIPDAGEETGEIDVSPADLAEEPLDLETEEVEVEPESAEKKIGDKEMDLEDDELADMIEKEGEEALKKEEEIDTKAGLDEESEEIDVSPAKRDESIAPSEDKEDFSEFLKEDFIEDIDFEDSSPKKSGSPEDVEEDIDVRPDEEADEETIEDIDTLMSEEGEIKSAIGRSASGGEDISLEVINGLEPIDFDEEDIGGEIATMTLSEIYISQSKYDKALQVLEILKEKEPDNPKIDEKIKEIKKNMNV